MSVSIRELAELVGGNVVGDPDIRIHTARAVDEAGAGEITFIEDVRGAKQLAACAASAAIVPAGLSAGEMTVIQAAEPLLAFAQIAVHLSGKPADRASGIDPLASIHATARIGGGVSIDPFVRVGAGTVIGDRCRLQSGVVVGANCRLGDDVVLHPNVVLYDDTVLGHRVVIHANAVLGADGFAYRWHDGRHVKVPHVGCVEVGNDVEIGAGTTIDRGLCSATSIGTGTKIDNLVQIGHNCRIGEHNILVAQVGIAGSCTTGANVILAGQVGVAPCLTIGTGAIVGAKAGVVSDVSPGERVLGAPAGPEHEQKRVLLTLKRLPAMRRVLQRLAEYVGLPEDREQAA